MTTKIGKDHCVSFLLNPNMFDIMKNTCEERGITRTDFLRSLIDIALSEEIGFERAQVSKLMKIQKDALEKELEAVLKTARTIQQLLDGHRVVEDMLTNGVRFGCPGPAEREEEKADNG